MQAGGEGHLAQTGGANSVKQKEAESGTAAQDRFWSALPWHVLVRLLPWESVLEARTMFSFTGLFQSPRFAPATSLWCFFAAFPPVSNRCAPASDRRWQQPQPSKLESSGASFSQATR